MFGSYNTETQQKANNAKGEVEEYLSSLRNNSQDDVLQLWKDNVRSLPRLAMVARKIFSIPSGSASAERVFSVAGLLSRLHHLSMKPETLFKLIFLKDIVRRQTEVVEDAACCYYFRGK
ncbi:hypothetical protein CRUP_022979 [Coryphaenoides rupestris]|nr:hypothetical protein CRUP_022979 [Coryphaenoides rupestris]